MFYIWKELDKSNEFENTEDSKDQYKLKIYGSGSRYEEIKKMESENINVNPYTDRSEILKETKNSTFALVSLSSSLTVEGFPGKTFDYLKMNKILIGYSNPSSGLARFIEKYNVGINIDPEKPNIDSALKALKNLDQIYQNIEDVNLKYANLNTVSQQYLSLI